MPLEISAPDPNEGAAVYVVTERLALTEDELRLVPEGSPDGRWLFAIPGQEIPFAVAVKFGLVSGDVPPVEHHGEPVKYAPRVARVEKKPTPRVKKR
jgi:hypothetical protein